MSIPSLPLFVAAQTHARRNPAKVAVVDTTKQQSFTFGQLLADAATLKKRVLGELGLSDSCDLDERRIAFLTPNGYDYVVAQWAVWAAGGVCVPLCKLWQLSNSWSVGTNINGNRHKPPCEGAPIYCGRLGPIPNPHPPNIRESGAGFARGMHHRHPIHELGTFYAH